MKYRFKRPQGFYSRIIRLRDYQKEINKQISEADHVVLDPLRLASMNSWHQFKFLLNQQCPIEMFDKLWANGSYGSFIPVTFKKEDINMNKNLELRMIVSYVIGQNLEYVLENGGCIPSKEKEADVKDIFLFEFFNITKPDVKTRILEEMIKYYKTISKEVPQIVLETMQDIAVSCCHNLLERRKFMKIYKTLNAEALKELNTEELDKFYDFINSNGFCSKEKFEEMIKEKTYNTKPKISLKEWEKLAKAEKESRDTSWNENFPLGKGLVSVYDPVNNPNEKIEKLVSLSKVLEIKDKRMRPLTLSEYLGRPKNTSIIDYVDYKGDDNFILTGDTKPLFNYDDYPTLLKNNIIDKHRNKLLNLRMAEILIEFNDKKYVLLVDMSAHNKFLPMMSEDRHRYIFTINMMKILDIFFDPQTYTFNGLNSDFKILGFKVDAEMEIKNLDLVRSFSNNPVFFSKWFVSLSEMGELEKQLKKYQEAKDFLISFSNQGIIPDLTTTIDLSDK